MRYRDQRLRELLAGEYALGTLHGTARRRFDRLLNTDPALRELVKDWDRRLHPLAEAAPPVQPHPRVWKAIQTRVTPAPAPRPGLWGSLGFWRGFAFATATMALVLAVYLGIAPPVATPPVYVAVLVNQQTQAAWLVSTDVDAIAQRIAIKTLHPQTLAPDKAFELWMLPGAGKNPRSLGLIPATGHTTLPLRGARLTELAVEGLAVSLEPAGGSPTGLPTGPVVYQGRLLSL